MDEEKLYLEHKPLIYMAMKRKHLFYETEDEFQEYYDAGLDGLLRGIRTFDENKGYKISTYLYKCILNELSHKLTIKNMKKRKNEYGRDISLNRLVDFNDDESGEFGDFIPDPNVDIEKELEDNLEKERLIYSVNKLQNEKDKLVIKMYYGIDGYEERKSYERVAEELGVSRECINQRLHRALKRLKPIYENVKDNLFFNNEKGTVLMDKKEAKNSLVDLNNILFSQLNRLTDCGKEQIDEEIRKSYAVAQLAQQITNNVNTCIKAMKLATDNKINDKKKLEFIGINE